MASKYEETRNHTSHQGNTDKNYKKYCTPIREAGRVDKEYATGYSVTKKTITVFPHFTKSLHS